MRYIYRPGHPKASKYGFVAEVDLDLQPESLALHAPVLVGRFYENTAATDGTDIGSRKRHREYMKRNNLAMADDFKGEWSGAERERQAIRSGEIDRKARREAVERAIHQIHKP
jgi:hypothetical protein